MEAMLGVEGVNFTHIDYAGEFVRRIAAHGVPKVLLTSGGDTPITDAVAKHIPPNLVAWHGVNIWTDDPRFHALPLGIPSDATYGDFETIRTYQNRPKTKSLFVSFCVGNNPKERIPAFNAATHIPGASGKCFEHNEHKAMPHDEFIREMAKHEFVLSPPGAQDSDTHRTWEALYLGCIPICKRGGPLRTFTDFPIMFVDDWREVTVENMNKARKELRHKWRNARKMLRLTYWMDRVKRSACQANKQPSNA